jgi:hypothetical protein
MIFAVRNGFKALRPQHQAFVLQALEKKSPGTATGQDTTALLSQVRMTSCPVESRETRISRRRFFDGHQFNIEKTPHKVLETNRER